MRPARLVTGIAGATAVTLTAGFMLTATAWADPLAPKSTFTMVVNPADGSTNVPSDGESVPNIDSVKSTIRAYYNASGGQSSKTSSRYITELHAIEQRLQHSLPANHAANAAVVFDIDDTLLWNYDYEDGGSNFNFNPATNLAAVNAGFPAMPGMPALLRTLHARGYALYGVTGRPGIPDPTTTAVNQEPVTLSNLAAQGFTDDGTPGGTPLFSAATLYTKDAAANPATSPQTIPTQGWVNCAADGTPASCSTVEYKAFTRQHIASVDSVDVVMNVGDQWSDLQGGFADDWTKIPNPTYFLASPDIAGAPASDANMVPPTSYVMQPDGSSGYSVASGDDIPNIDPVRRMIRGYYNAPNSGTPAQVGVADKVSSPYISQLASLTSTWTTQVTTDCTTASTARQAATQKKATATQAVDAAQAAVTKNTKAVAKAKKKVANAKNPQARRKAHQKLAKARKALKTSRAALADARDALGAITVPDAPAMVFDADDTTLWNYDLEDNVMHFVFDPAAQQVWISGHLMPAVPGMVALVKAAAASGCAIFGVTGRPTSQQADTIANLTEKGYVDAANKPLFTAAQFVTKGTVSVVGGSASIPTQPWVDCNADGTRGACSTIEYKSATRGHIEAQGFDIVGNFGDQFSDLIGGFADHTYKVPNPTYYLP
jgi:predicted secreted acid phosphatase